MHQTFKKAAALFVAMLVSFFASWAIDYKFFENNIIARPISIIITAVPILILFVREIPQKIWIRFFIPALFVALASALAYTSIQYNNTVHDLEACRSQLTKLRMELSDAQKESNELFGQLINEQEEASKDIEKRQENARKALFLDNQIALVVYPYGEVYHRYDCYYFQNCNEYLAYNIDAAESLGYEPCAICH